TYLSIGSTLNDCMNHFTEIIKSLLFAIKFCDDPAGIFSETAAMARNPPRFTGRLDNSGSLYRFWRLSRGKICDVGYL
ncbi:MAG: hypothetical protein ACKVT0_06300, partial [Planctomycetaceae bacterium]